MLTLLYLLFPFWHLESPEVSLELQPLCPKDNPPLMSKANATEHIERDYSQSLCVFTDGSKTPDGATGAAFVTPELHVTKTVRLPAHVSVFTCELVTIILALFGLDEFRPVRDTIFTDSISALQAFTNNGKKTSKTYLRDPEALYRVVSFWHFRFICLGAQSCFFFDWMGKMEQHESQSGNVTSEEEEAGDEVSEELVIDDPDAEGLDLNHSRIAKMENLEQLTKIQYLCLRQNLIKKIECLSTLSTLTELDLYDNQLTNVENLESLVNLEILDLSFNRIRKIEGLENLTKLKKLFFVNNKITKIENINHLTELEMLELGANRIRVIENISNLTKLTSLYIGKNKLTRIQGLETQVNLTCLSIQSNRLLKIEGLETLVKLDELYISHNGIECISGLENNVNLTTLDLAGNRIKRLENLSHLSQLEEFWFNDNKLDVWDDVEQLASLKTLRTVYLERNPIWYDPCGETSDPSYRRKVLIALPGLEQLDATLCRTT
ncbi:hypothetical protein ScPMuIL_007779 [Solemya velum]